MAIDSYEGYQTHFGFEHFDLALVAFFRSRMILTLIITTRDGETIPSPIVNLFIHHLNSILPTSNVNRLYTVLALRIKCWRPLANLRQTLNYCIPTFNPLLTKSLLCNVAAFTRMPYISESSDIQSLFL